MAAELHLSRGRFAYLRFAVVTVILLLATANYVVGACCQSVGLRSIQFLDVGAEPSLPTWWSVLNLGLAAALAGGLAVVWRRRAIVRY